MKNPAEAEDPGSIAALADTMVRMDTMARTATTTRMVTMVRMVIKTDQILIN